MEEEIRNWLERNPDQIGIGNFEIIDVKSGESNYNFILEADRKYVFRVSKDISRENRLGNEYQGLRFLKEQGIQNVPDPVQLKEDTELGDVILIGFVGEKDLADLGFQKEHLTSVAHLLAEIHSTSIKEYNRFFDKSIDRHASLRKEYRRDFQKWSKEPYEKYMETTSKPKPCVKKYFDKQKQLLDSIPETTIERSFTHGDLSFNIRSTDKEIFIVDWEYARIGYPGHEIMYFFEHEELNDNQRKHFLAEYRKHRDLSDVFRKVRAIHRKFLAFNDFIWAANRLEKNPERDEMREIFDNRLEKLETLYKE